MRPKITCDETHLRETVPDLWVFERYPVIRVVFTVQSGPAQDLQDLASEENRDVVWIASPIHEKLVDPANLAWRHELRQPKLLPLEVAKA
jgi:hypothetical protein